jgi:hypothetical protein
VGNGSIPGWGNAGLAGDPAYWPPVLTRAYHGKQGETAALYAQDATFLSAYGYTRPSSSTRPGSGAAARSYSPRSRSCSSASAS